MRGLALGCCFTCVIAAMAARARCTHSHVVPLTDLCVCFSMLLHHVRRDLSRDFKVKKPRVAFSRSFTFALYLDGACGRCRCAPLHVGETGRAVGAELCAPSVSLSAYEPLLF